MRKFYTIEHDGKKFSFRLSSVHAVIVEGSNGQELTVVYGSGRTDLYFKNAKECGMVYKRLMSALEGE